MTQVPHDVPDDPLPAGVRRRHGLCGYADALRGIHRPVDQADVARARQRLKWDEAFTLQVLLAQRRLAATSYSAIPRPVVDGGLLAEFDGMIPFELTEPRSLDEAIVLLDAEDDSVRPIAGGTALMLMMKAGVFHPTRLVALRRVAGGDAIELAGEERTHREFARHRRPRSGIQARRDQHLDNRRAR